MILVMLWVGFGVPSLNLAEVSTQSPIVYAGFVLVFAYTAYVAEVYRAGLMSVRAFPRSEPPAVSGLSSHATLAPGGAPTSRAERPPGVAQRLRVAPEGYRYRLHARGRRGGPFRPDRRGRRVQLFRFHYCVPALPRRHRPAHPLHGPCHGAGPVSPGMSQAQRHEHSKDGKRRALDRSAGRPPPRCCAPSVCAQVLRQPSRCCEVSTLTITAARGVMRHRFVGIWEVDPATLLQSSRAGRLQERIELFGHDLGDERIDEDLVRRHTGMVFQSFSLFPHLSVLDNVTPPRRSPLLRFERRLAEQSTPESCSAASAWRTRLSEFPDGLSGGQQQQATIVRSLCNEPPATAPRRGHLSAGP